MGTEPAPVVDCTKCGDELNGKRHRFCQSCLDEARADAERDCDHCHKPADVCDDCAGANLGEKAREYATRRKALGLLSIDGYNAIMLMAEDLEAIHG